MSKDLLVNGKAVPASTKSTLVIEEFLMEYYCFRQNILNGKVEFSTKMNNGEFGPFETLTQKSLNTIILRAKEDAGDEMKNPQADIKLYVTSDLVPKFDPIADYLNSLPKWDGHNYVADLFGRIPGITSEQAAFLAKWIRSAVAHWLQMDTLHANEVVPTFIGAQGCGKTTFLRRLLPEHLRQYHPLTDATGSRRYICMQIPDGKFIDNDGDINYEQLYAQVLYELRELNAPYWFDNDEVARIQDLNQNYLEQKDMACLVEACFRKPEEDEHAETMNSTEMLKVIRHAYPSLVINRTAKVNLKATMKELNFDIVSHAHVDYYKVVPKKSA